MNACPTLDKDGNLVTNGGVDININPHVQQDSLPPSAGGISQPASEPQPSSTVESYDRLEDTLSNQGNIL